MGFSLDKGFLNSDLVCVVTKNTESFHTALVSERREGNIGEFVSLTWNRMENEYIIHCDAGRPCRPLYREGTKPETIRSAKSWNLIMNHMDYIDAQESECIRVSMIPFHPDYLSEIHGSAIFLHLLVSTHSPIITKLQEICLHANR